MAVHANSIVFAISVGLAGCAVPQPTQPRDAIGMAGQVAPSKPIPVGGDTASAAIRARQQGMKTIGRNFEALARELGATPQIPRIIEVAAGDIAYQSKKAEAWFPRGSGPESGATRAKLEIWQNPNDFNSKLADFQNAADRLHYVSATSAMYGIRDRFYELRDTCKACHDKYRAEISR